MLGYDLVGTSEDPIDVIFDAGVVRVCLESTAFDGHTGADGKRFLAKLCGAPTACIPPGSPSGAFVED